MKIAKRTFVQLLLGKSANNTVDKALTGQQWNNPRSGQIRTLPDVLEADGIVNNKRRWRVIGADVRARTP